MYVIRNTCSVIPSVFLLCQKKNISVVIFFNLANTIQLALSVSGSEMRKPFVCIETFPLTTSSNNGLSHFRMRAYQCAEGGDIFVQQKFWKHKIFTKNLEQFVFVFLTRGNYAKHIFGASKHLLEKEFVFLMRGNYAKHSFIVTNILETKNPVCI